MSGAAPADPGGRDDAHWRQKLTPLQYEVARRGGTEAPFSGEYNDHKRDGEYRCVCCGETLFASAAKYESGSGWPSFYAPAQDAPIEEHSDHSHGMVRTEVRCSACDAHLGHVFPDGPQPTGLRYCINSCSLQFQEEEGGS